MSGKSERLWGAIYRLGTGDRPNEIPAKTIDDLVELNIAEIAGGGVARLTEYGEKCFEVIESGDESVPELDGDLVV